MTCCLGASEAEIEEEPELYQCETCPVAEMIDDLYPENADAWTVYMQALSRFAVDTHTVPLVVEAMVGDLAPRERADLFRRLAVLYGILNPPPETSHGS